MIALTIGLGVVVGLSLGALGGGGSLLMVPLLVFVLHQETHAATTTALAVVGATAAIGAIPYIRQGRVAFRTALPFGLAGIAATVLGARLNQLLDGRLILVLFGLLMLGVAARMILGSRRQSSPAGRQHTGRTWPQVLLAGLLVGLLTGFFGVGGGFLVVPALVLILGLNMRVAVGTSLVVIAINSATGLAAHLRYGSVDLTVALLFGLGAAAGALLGGSLSGRVNERSLQTGFGALVGLVGIWLFAGNLLQLTSTP